MALKMTIWGNEMNRVLLFSAVLLTVGIDTLSVGNVRAQGLQIYVSINGNDQDLGTLKHPIKTLQEAQKLIHVERESHPSTPITVFLRQGTYYLDTTLLFTSKEYSKNEAPVIFRNYKNENVAISGARRLYLKWKTLKNGIYQARLPDHLNFDQLFVNGERQILARYPNYDLSAAIFHGVSRDALSSQRIKSWKHPEGGFIHGLQKAHWGSLSYLIVSKKNQSHLKVEGGYQINRYNQIDSNAVFVENIREELDTTHEWYYDHSKNILYFIPPKGLNLQQAKIEVPVLRKLIVLEGDSLSPVCNIQFKGLTFSQTLRTFMLTMEPLLRGDWKIYRGGAVFLQDTKYCTFDKCNFESLGGNAMFFNDFDRRDTIKHCLIRDIGANGICFIGDPSSVRSPSFFYKNYIPYDKLDKTPGPKNNDFPRNCYVYDNLIYNIGEIEKQTAGIELSMCMSIKIIHNTIYHTPRSGININDGCWGGDVIADNEVFETVMETGDNGAFNSWGRDRFWSPNRHYTDSLLAIHPELVKLDAIHPILISHNLFRCDNGWDIDLDDGSTNYIIDSNLCLHGGIKNREGFYRTVENNIMVNNTFHPHVWFKNSHEVFRHNILMRPYAPIEVKEWGDSIDYNLFPDSVAYEKAEANGTDQHSAVAIPGFCNPMKGNYKVKVNKVIYAIGFHNFSMNDFGVISPYLKTISRKPDYPIPFIDNHSHNALKVLHWEGATLKEVEGLDEQSALGLPKPEGVYIMKILKESLAYKKGFRRNDVILKIDNSVITSLDDFLRILSRNKRDNILKIKIYRDQQYQWMPVKPRRRSF